MPTATFKALAPAFLATSLFVSACAPVIEGGPAFDLPVGLQDTAQLRRVYMSSDWLQSEDDFTSTFHEEVEEELHRCMYGTAPIDVRIHLDHLERAGRLETLFNGRGENRLTGTVEFVDPARGDQVVGRFPVSVIAHETGGLESLLADRQMVVSEAFGRAVCEQGFGRNPRRPGPANATAD